MSLFYGIGLDLGQRGDPAAIVVANDLEARSLAVRIQYQSAEKAGVATSSPWGGSRCTCA